jgi:SAM-dependent methyltransferase
MTHHHPPMTTAMTCRGCGSPDLANIHAFGETPLADRLLRPDHDGADYTAPLTLALCGACSLVQLRETVAPRILFGPEYPYYSSVSKGLLAHFATSARAIIQRLGLGPNDLVIEAASNDGYMLDVFREAGLPVLGIDPADGPVAAARARGIETLHDFFTEACARRLAAEGRRARVLLANNVLAHVADTNDFLRGVAVLLAEDGLFVAEFPYLLDLVDNGEFDTIYHQHLLYLSLTAAKSLLERNGLVLVDVERTAIHGGSLRIFAAKSGQPATRVVGLLAEEARRGIGSIQFFAPFVDRIERIRCQTTAAIAMLRAEGRTIAGYGAAAKATTLLSVLGLGRDDLAFIVDKNTWKQGLQMPGTRIPIVAPDRLDVRAADAVLVLAWNFADEIMAENESYLAAGGRFLIPVPELREVARAEAAA